jgi:hypothetical protein
MTRWLSYFAEYNFVVHYKPGKSNIFADVLSRRPDYDPRSESFPVVDADDDDDCAVCIASGVNTVSMHAVGTLRQQIAAAYDADAFYSGVIDYHRAPSDKALRRLTAMSHCRATSTGPTCTSRSASGIGSARRVSV